MLDGFEIGVLRFPRLWVDNEMCKRDCSGEGTKAKYCAGDLHVLIGLDSLDPTLDCDVCLVNKPLGKGIPR